MLIQRVFSVEIGYKRTLGQIASDIEKPAIVFALVNPVGSHKNLDPGTAYP
jgi:hypothetical protein